MSVQLTQSKRVLWIAALALASLVLLAIVMAIVTSSGGHSSSEMLRRAAAAVDQLEDTPFKKDLYARVAVAYADADLVSEADEFDASHGIEGTNFRIALIGARVRSGDDAGARRDIDRLSNQVHRQRGHLEMAVALVVRGDLDDGVKVFREITGTSSDSTAAGLLQLATALRDNQNASGATSALKQLSELATKVFSDRTGEVFLEVAAAQLKHGDRAGCAQTLDRAFTAIRGRQSGEDVADGLGAIAVIQSQMGDDAACRKTMATAIATAKGLPRSRAASRFYSDDTPRLTALERIAPHQAKIGDHSGLDETTGLIYREIEQLGAADRYMALVRVFHLQCSAGRLNDAETTYIMLGSGDTLLLAMLEGWCAAGDYDKAKRLQQQLKGTYEKLRGTVSLLGMELARGEQTSISTEWINSFVESLVQLEDGECHRLVERLVAILLRADLIAAAIQFAEAMNRSSLHEAEATAYLFIAKTLHDQRGLGGDGESHTPRKELSHRPLGTSADATPKLTLPPAQTIRPKEDLTPGGAENHWATRSLVSGLTREAFLREHPRATLEHNDSKPGIGWLVYGEPLYNWGFLKDKLIWFHTTILRDGEKMNAMFNEGVEAFGEPRSTEISDKQRADGVVKRHHWYVEQDDLSITFIAVGDESGVFVFVHATIQRDFERLNNLLGAR
ncbi:MAG: hypothetical protein WD768_20535 [Phycisphaeraceae bacterium]